MRPGARRASSCSTCAPDGAPTGRRWRPSRTTAPATGTRSAEIGVPPPDRLDSFDFDGSTLAFAHTRYRPDGGSADDGLKPICVGDRIIVQDTATVIEVRPVRDAIRPLGAELPVAPPYRSRWEERPECPYRD